MKLTTDEFSDVASVNPWRSDLWQLVKNCYVRGKFTRSQEQVCSPDTPVGEREDWEQMASDNYSLLLMKAIAATLKGLREFMASKCTDFKDCEDIYEQSETTRREIYASVIEVEMANDLENLLEGKPYERPFNDDGNGNVGYDIYNLWNNEYKLITNIVPESGKVEFEVNLTFALKDGIQSTDDTCFRTTSVTPTTPATPTSPATPTRPATLTAPTAAPPKLGYIALGAIPILIIIGVIMFRHWKAERSRE